MILPFSLSSDDSGLPDELPSCHTCNSVIALTDDGDSSHMAEGRKVDMDIGTMVESREDVARTYWPQVKVVRSRHKEIS